ncbi:cytochrome P450 CYP5293A2 [Talaromyces proteolyticus]|uniref:Cytochrome P450 CYP5293A2 n=1 Tax=Talaromyces proteolyticus TaxID=1131652 RepID=A0AAD4KUJ0_9EURO|nr:cytochrome P450 CYP5293A2 [Talaromyces proteolyticus]KAH8697071.1 cytochrome P450 CYP5293A2 [Talaromyces proteolyticus]
MLQTLFIDGAPLSIMLCIVSIVLIFMLMRHGTSGAFKDKSGRKMKQVRGDTRVRRFSHGRELSDEGYALGQGDPYIIRNGGRKEVVLCKPQHLREFFTVDGKDHWKAPDGNMGYFFHRLLGECVGANSRHEWRKIRSLFDPIYSSNAMSKLTHIFRGEVQDWLVCLSSHSSTQTQRRAFFTVDMSEQCARLPLKLVASTLYGDALSDESFADLMELARIREELGSNAFLGLHMISKIYALLPTRANRQLDRYTTGFRELNLQMVATAEQRNLECPLMHILREIHATGCVSMKQFLHTIDEILFENLDVASSALSYLLLNVASDATAQDDLRREMQHVREHDTAEDAYLARSDTFLEHCCAESRRLCPPICFTFCERSPSDKLIGGFLVPANTDVTTDWKRISIDSPIWSVSVDGGHKVDGYDFYPARYSQLSKGDCRYSLVGYGAGVRKCLGQHFASLLMRIVLLAVVSKYRISTEVRPWRLGFRRDKFVLTPRSHELVFEAI